MRKVYAKRMKTMRQEMCQQGKGSVLGKDCSKVGVSGCLREMNWNETSQIVSDYFGGFGHLRQVTVVMFWAVGS